MPYQDKCRPMLDRRYSNAALACQPQPVALFWLAILLTLLAGCGGSGGSASDTPKAASSSGVAQAGSLQLINFSNDETLRYPLPILIGRTTADVRQIRITTGGKSYITELVDTYFKVLIPLQVGVNEITLHDGRQTSTLRLHYLPADNPKKVRMMYAIAADDDGRFVAEPGMPNSMEDAKARIALQALLMQSATAEMLYKGARQRITYALQLDAAGNPAVPTLRLPLTRAQLYAKTDQEIYQVIERALQDADMFENVKSMVTMGFSNYRNGQFLAHAALGGGNLGIFGALHLYACPAQLDQVLSSFSNDKTINIDILPEDSGGRGTYWAQCATGMGASLHELGHSFGLDHTPGGIMARGFDHFNRLFVMREPGFATALTMANEGGAKWDAASIDVLLRSEWFRK